MQEEEVIYIKVDQTVISPSLSAWAVAGFVSSCNEKSPSADVSLYVIRTMQSFGRARAKVVKSLNLHWSTTVALFSFVSCPKFRWPTFCEFSSLCRLLIVMIVLLCTRPSVYTMEIISLALYIRLRCPDPFFVSNLSYVDRS